MEDNYEIVDNEVYSEINEENLVYMENQPNLSLKVNGVVSDRTSIRREDVKKASIASIGSIAHSQHSQTSKASNKKVKSMINTSINKSTLIGISSLNSSSHQKKPSNASGKKPHKHNSMNNTIPYGERLYRKAVALKEEKQRRHQDMKVSESKAVEKQCSFKPVINDESCFIALKKTFSSNILENNLVTGTNFPSPAKKVIESYLKKKEEEEMSELRPSKKKTMKEVEDLTNKLFKEAETLKVVKEREKDIHYSNTCPFAPKIIDSSKPKVENFYKRLHSWVEKRNENYLKDMEEAKKCSKTGQLLFSPQITKRESERAARNVFIDLYEENKKLNQGKKESWEKKEEEISKLVNSKKATNKMEELHNSHKYECFLKIFQILDVDEDNLISYNEQFLQTLEKNLTEETRNILEPLLNEFSIHNETLNKEEFVLALDQLYGVLNVYQRRKLVNWYVNDVKRENSPRKRRTMEQIRDYNFSFRPSMSDLSSKLFENSQRHSKDLLVRNMEFLKKKESFIQMKNEEKLTHEIKDCTFRPSVSISPNKLHKA